MAVAMLVASPARSRWCISPNVVAAALATTGTEVEDLQLRRTIQALGGRVQGAGRAAAHWVTAPGFCAMRSRRGSAPIRQVAHNSFISVAVETGIIGLLLYLDDVRCGLPRAPEAALLRAAIRLVLLAHTDGWPCCRSAGTTRSRSGSCWGSSWDCRRLPVWASRARGHRRAGPSGAGRAPATRRSSRHLGPCRFLPEPRRIR